MKTYALVSLLLALLALPLAAATYDWTGGGANANWDTVGNWAGGAVPASTDKGQFQTGGTSASLNGADRSLAQIIVTNTTGFTFSGFNGATTNTLNFTGTVNPQRYVEQPGTWAITNSGDRVFNCNVTLPAIGAYCDRQLVYMTWPSPASGSSYNFIFNGKVTFGARTANGADWIDLDASAGPTYPNVIFNDSFFVVNNNSRAFTIKTANNTFTFNGSNFFNGVSLLSFTAGNWKSGTIYVGHNNAIDTSSVQLDLGLNSTSYNGNNVYLRAYVNKPNLFVSGRLRIWNDLTRGYVGADFAGTGTSTWNNTVRYAAPTVASGLTPAQVYFKAAQSGNRIVFAGRVYQTTWAVTDNHRPVFIEGPGTVVFKATNDIPGTITVQANGTFVAENNVCAAGWGSLSVSSGATLGGSGVLSNATTVAGGAYLKPGSSVGTLTIGNSLTLNANATNVFEKGPAGTADKVVCGALTIGSPVVIQLVNDGGSAGAYDVTNTIFDATSFSGLANLQLDLSQTPGWTGGEFVDLGNSDIGLTGLIPEPALLALLALPLLWLRRA